MKKLTNLLVVVMIVTLALSSIVTAAQPSPLGEGKELGTFWKYTALGDSLATGFRARRGYVPRYEGYIEEDTEVSVVVTNLARNGMTSGELLEALQSDRNMRRAVSQSQVVTWDIGGADFLAARRSYKEGTCGGDDNQECLRETWENFKLNWAGIITETLSLRSTDDTIIRTMNLYNPFVDEDTAEDTWNGHEVCEDLNNDGECNDFEVFKPYIDAVNEYMCTEATSNGIPCADVYLEFNGSEGNVDPEVKGYLSLDGVHPNDKGHEAIAVLLRALEYAPLNK